MPNPNHTCMMSLGADLWVCLRQDDPTASEVSVRQRKSGKIPTSPATKVRWCWCLIFSWLYTVRCNLWLIIHCTLSLFASYTLYANSFRWLHTVRSEPVVPNMLNMVTVLLVGHCTLNKGVGYTLYADTVLRVIHCTLNKVVGYTLYADTALLVIHCTPNKVVGYTLYAVTGLLVKHCTLFRIVG
jgi:hypothetical protein